MNIIGVRRAKVEAKRFLDRLAEVELKHSEDDMAFHGCRETAALRRASMDLTKALADLRRPG